MIREINVLTIFILLLILFIGGCALPKGELDEYSCKQITEWDENNNKSREWKYNSSDDLEEYIVFFYGSSNQLLIVKIYDSTNALDSDLISRTEYEYNQTEFPLLPTDGFSYDSNGFVFHSFQTSYNSQGNYLTTTINDILKDLVSVRTATYDETGENYLMERYFENDVLIEQIQRQYNDNFIDATNTCKQYTREDHQIYQPASENSNVAYERDMTRLYYWDIHNQMYMEEIFDESDELTDVNIFEHIHGLKNKQYHYHKGILSSYHTYQYESPVNNNNTTLDDWEENLVEDLYYTSVGYESYLKKKILYEYYRENDLSYTMIKTYTFQIHDENELTRGVRYFIHPHAFEQ